MSKARDRIQALASAAASSAAPRDDADSPRLQSFLRGLSIGALVGAAIAGSAIWERSQRRRSHKTSADDVDVELKTGDEPTDR